MRACVCACVKMVWERWCVGKMVCEKVLCERWRVTKRGRRRRRDGGGTAEAGRRRDGGGTEAASTKSQTRTPHKDVGQNMLVIALEIKSV